jgi:hypothetical protein
MRVQTRLKQSLSAEASGLLIPFGNTAKVKLGLKVGIEASSLNQASRTGAARMTGAYGSCSRERRDVVVDAHVAKRSTM